MEIHNTRENYMKKPVPPPPEFYKLLPKIVECGCKTLWPKYVFTITGGVHIRNKYYHMNGLAEVRIQSAVNCGAVQKETNVLYRIMEIDKGRAVVRWVWSDYETDIFQTSYEDEATWQLFYTHRSHNDSVSKALLLRENASP
jgi:hypothetical protein